MTDKPKNKTIDHIATGRLHRRMLMTKAGVTAGAKMATDMYTNFLSGMWTDKAQREIKRKESFTKQTHYLIDEMGKLKGSVVKVGQMMALYGEHFLPPEVTEALHRFEDQTTSLDWSVIEPVLRKELGARFAELDINPEPMAAASLGQVHRAIRISDGTEICLKVQYPGVAESIDSDIGDVVSLMKLAKLITTGKDFDNWLDDVRQMMHRETDYCLEAETTQYFHDLLASNPSIIVPNVYSEYSTKCVLATSYEDGLSPTHKDVLSLSLERRNKICWTFLDVFFKEIYCWNRMQGDPNFGNYRVRIHDDGMDQLVLLDFGAVQVYPESFMEPLKMMIKGAFYDDLEQVKQGAIELHMLEESFPDDVKTSFAEVCCSIIEPFRYDEMDVPENAVTEFGYHWKESDLPSRVIKEAIKKAVSLYFSVPPKEFMFLYRKLLGVYTFVAVLDGQFNGRKLIEEYVKG